jgi:hypothetical protein
VTIEGHDGTRPNIEQVFYTLYHPVFWISNLRPKMQEQRLHRMRTPSDTSQNVERFARCRRSCSFDLDMAGRKTAFHNGGSEAPLYDVAGAACDCILKS